MGATVGGLAAAIGLAETTVGKSVATNGAPPVKESAQFQSVAANGTAAVGISVSAVAGAPGSIVSCVGTTVSRSFDVADKLAELVDVTIEGKFVEARVSSIVLRASLSLRTSVEVKGAVTRVLVGRE